MAQYNQYNNMKTNYGAARNSYQASQNTYIYGNTVRKADVYGNTVRKEQKKREENKQIQENTSEKQKRYSVMNVKYVLFLVMATLVSLSLCVGYLCLQSIVLKNARTITSMQNELYALKEANASRKNAMKGHVNLIEIKQIAENELGMVYPKEGQIIEYYAPTNKNVIQYYNMPDDGFLFD